MGNLFITLFFGFNMLSGMFLMFFGFIQAAFAGGWATGDKFQLIIGFLFMAVGFATTIAFTMLMKKSINGDFRG